MMKKLRLNIDGREVVALPGQTILEVARENDVDIPTLCFDERTEIYGSCGLCVVEVEANPKLVKACATEIAEGMVIHTRTERVLESRKSNLELLLSNHVGDCRPPCVLGCPGQTDCQGYVGLIANGEMEKAIQLIKEKIPLPGAIGRVCPHPCEDNCRRKYVEEPISIAWLKRYAADVDLAGDDPFLPDVAPATGKKVAIVGGGPLGLSAAYFLRQKGHEITLFDAMPKMGGMLRYGIPEYRLPKEELDEEIYLIERMGVEMRPNTKVGVDVTMAALRKEYDAVLLGIGAWLSTGVGCQGEDAVGVIGGIDFLRKVVRNEEIKIGDKVAIVGGGNTAMDACRTAVRLGASKVYNIYRRTKDEMPADRIEIEEGEEEGVIFKYLTNPIEITKDNQGRVTGMRLQKMELGEPDASGRRAPKPIPGEEEVIELDTVILAIGQAVDPTGLDGLDLTRKKGVFYDEKTFLTNLPGVFAGGDCGNDKISIAIEAIADAKKAAESIDAYLAGQILRYEKPYYVERHDLNETSFEDRERQFKSHMDHLAPAQRRDNFTEVVAGFTMEEAVAEAKRCLECGCHDYFECKLIDFAHQYDVKPARFEGAINATDYDDNHPFIVRDPNKCVVCGLCVRVCDEVVGVGALGLVHRGFDVVVKPTMEGPLAESGCVSCGQCVAVCPTGALQERLKLKKSVPLDTDKTDTTCSYCSVGCSLTLESYGNMLVKATPIKEGAVNQGLVCGKGKFGFDGAYQEGKLLEPMIRKNGVLEEVDYHEAFILAAKKAQSIGAKYGKDAVAVSISDRYTNEEAYAIQKFAQVIGAKTFSFNNRENGLAKVLGFDASPNTIDELLSTDVILVAGFSTMMNPVIQLKLMEAAKRGVKILLVNPDTLPQKMPYAHRTHYVSNDLSFLKEVAKALLDLGKTSTAEGFDTFEKSLAKVKPSAEAVDIASIYANAKKAMILFQQNVVSVDAASLLTELAVLSGHIGKARDGILLVKAKNNSQGLVDLGITAGAEAMEGVKALFVFGEDPAIELPALEFLMVSDTHLTQTASQADVILPGTGFASVDGTFTNTERRLQGVEQAIEEDVLYSNWEIACELAHVFEVELPYEDVVDIVNEMEEVLPGYRQAKLGLVTGGVLVSKKTIFVPVGDLPFVQPLACTDALMNGINARLPKPPVPKAN